MDEGTPLRSTLFMALPNCAAPRRELNAISPAFTPGALPLLVWWLGHVIGFPVVFFYMLASKVLFIWIGNIGRRPFFTFLLQFGFFVIYRLILSPACRLLLDHLGSAIAF